MKDIPRREVALLDMPDDIGEERVHGSECVEGQEGGEVADEKG